MRRSLAIGTVLSLQALVPRSVLAQSGILDSGPSGILLLAGGALLVAALVMAIAISRDKRKQAEKAQSRQQNRAPQPNQPMARSSVAQARQPMPPMGSAPPPPGSMPPPPQIIAPAQASDAGMVYCVRCGQPLSGGLHFCTRCGAEQPVAVSPQSAQAMISPMSQADSQEGASLRVCVNCGAPLEEGLPFCTRCGTRQPDSAPASPVPGLADVDSMASESDALPMSTLSATEPAGSDASAQTCAKCGAERVPGLRFCTRCGSEQPVEAGKAESPAESTDEVSGAAPSERLAGPPAARLSQVASSPPAVSAPVGLEPVAMSRLPRDDKFVSMQSLSGDRAANAPPSPVLSRPQDAPIAPPAQEGADEALAARSLKDERIDDAGSQAADSAMADDLAGAEPELLEAASGGAPTEALGPDDSADIAEPDLPEEIVHDKQSVEMIVSDGGDMPDSLAEPECVEPPNEIVAESVTQGSGVVTDASDTVPPDDGEPEPEEVVVEVPMADEDAVEIDAAATVMPVIESLAEETQTQAPQDVSQEESLAPPSVDRVSEPVSMVRGELVLGVVPSVERIKAGRRQMFNLVLTSHRLLLARITAPMLRAAAAQARESGIDLTGISGMSSLGNAVLCSRYASQAPDQILSTHDDNFGMSLASVRQIQIIEATDDDDSDVMIIHALREVAYTLPLGASEQARRTLRSVLGDDLVP